MLALFGGEPTNKKKFEWNSSIDEKDIQAVVEVMESKVLSDFYGSPGERFLGGRKVKELDRVWAEYFQVAHAVSMNSATSALYAAVGALGLGPGDEVIVPPMTMAASVACVLGYNAIPVFADIENDFFCIDPQSIEKVITPRTKAIVVVDLFGQSADFNKIMELKKKYNLKIIEDCAQAPGATYNGKYTGTIGDIGIYSLNCHKAIQCGEGGVAVTNDPEYALRLQLIRNHAEAVVEGIGYTNLVNMLGQNYRMTEMQAAIAIEQLKKLKSINEYKVEMAAYLDEKLGKFPFLQTPRIREKSSHVYYLYVLKYDAQVLGVSRDRFVQALNAEGYNASFGYVKPIYLLPLFQQKIVYGKNGCPFSCLNNIKVNYSKGLCPVSEDLHFNRMFYPNLIRYKITKEDIDVFASAVDKVASHAIELT
jgi:perosamine synthetase